MRTPLILRYLWLVALPLLALSAFANDDAEGCKDSPLVMRMPGFFISGCETKEFESYAFHVTEDSTVAVEGKYTNLNYSAGDSIKESSRTLIFRNYVNAFTKAGWKMVWQDKNYSGELTAVYTKDGKETWVSITIESDGGRYYVWTVERQAMKQYVSASEMLDALNKDGFIALHINFDTGKSTIKEDSREAVGEMVNLMKNNPSLKVEIGGHTDNVGDEKANLKLSQDRANAVMKAMTDGGVEAARMTAVGYGQSKPVADNRTEDGRAQNRRVELVKK